MTMLGTRNSLWLRRYFASLAHQTAAERDQENHPAPKQGRKNYFQPRSGDPYHSTLPFLWLQMVLRPF